MFNGSFKYNKIIYINLLNNTIKWYKKNNIYDDFYFNIIRGYNQIIILENF